MLSSAAYTSKYRGAGRVPERSANPVGYLYLSPRPSRRASGDVTFSVRRRCKYENMVCDAIPAQAAPAKKGGSGRVSSVSESSRASNVCAGWLSSALGALRCRSLYLRSVGGLEVIQGQPSGYLPSLGSHVARWGSCVRDSSFKLVYVVFSCQAGFAGEGTVQ